jgi:hypothetical protein
MARRFNLLNALWKPPVRYSVELKQSIEPKNTIMKTSAIPHENKGRAATPAKAAPSISKRLSKGSVANVLAPKTRAMAKPVRLLLERFPNPDEGRICIGVYAPDAQSVFVAGSFNGWQPSAMPLEKQASGRWVIELTLDPGRHEYRFIVDGQWKDDPLSPAYVSNPFGGLNSVLGAAIQA